MAVSVRRKPVRALSLLALAFAALALGPGASAASAGSGGVVGAAYSETNGVPNNAVIAYDRLANGQLVQREVVPTGGMGGLAPQPGCEPPGGCPMLDTQGEVVVTDNGKLVFAVNAGDNTISAFRETNQGLKLVDVQGSNGQFPNSLTVHKHVLYVLNSNALNTGVNSIAGFRFTSKGELTPIPNSVRTLSSPQSPPGLAPRQIGFDKHRPRTGGDPAGELRSAGAAQPQQHRHVPAGQERYAGPGHTERSVQAAAVRLRVRPAQQPGHVSGHGPSGARPAGDHGNL